jgi:hypothetical protein
MPVRNMPSKVPAPPIDATGHPTSPQSPALRRTLSGTYEAKISD